MKLKTITFTGIDDRTKIEDLQKLQYFFPNAEFGVLISKNWDKNGNRYMSPSKIRELEGSGLNLSAHLCGQAARDAANGNWFIPDYITQGQFSIIFKRCQLNIAGADPYMPTAIDNIQVKELIIQVKSILTADRIHFNNIRKQNPNSKVTMLIDPSGGQGIDNGLTVLDTCYKTGYAGGINENNIRQKIIALESSGAVRKYWLDMESSVRTDDWFDTQKAAAILWKYEETRRFLREEKRKGGLK